MAGYQQGIPPKAQSQPAVMVIPVTYQSMTPNEGRWTSDLFDCCFDPGLAITTYCCPCVIFGRMAEILDEGHTMCFTGGVLFAALSHLAWVLSYNNRRKLRKMYNLPEIPAPDYLVHFLCICCAITQEYRELRFRGIEPAIGWYGNTATNDANPVIVAPIPQRM